MGHMPEILVFLTGIVAIPSLAYLGIRAALGGGAAPAVRCR